MKGAVLGIDTSCYTTSVALAGLNREILSGARKLITVGQGERGLRQSEGVFQHVTRLPEMVSEAVSKVDAPILAVCASTRPRDVEGSYMPVFTVGEGTARALASALRVPFYPTSHQEGHLRAAMVGTQLNAEKPYLALHLSGGTSEMLLVRPETAPQLIGATGDLHAGQLVDRTGVLLGLPFPCGPSLESLAMQGRAAHILPTSLSGLTVSFSGAEGQLKRMHQAGGHSDADLGAEVFSFLARQFVKWLKAGQAETGCAQALLFGGVASSALLRELMAQRLSKQGISMRIHWAQPQLSGDNAVGVALIGAGKYLREKDVSV